MWLQVSDKGNLGVNYDLLLQSNGGNVGIGTTNPSQKLEVVGGEIKAGRVDSSIEGGQISFGRSTDNATSWYIDNYGNSSSTQLRFVNVANSVVAMTITGSNVGINQTDPSQILDVSGAIRSGVGISNGSSIAKATSRTLYKVIVSSNYDAGNAVRGGEWNVILNNEGSAVTNTTQIYNYNSQTATFSVSGGNLIINGLNAGNTICAVYTN
jgi:hypothetical protein